MRKGRACAVVSSSRISTTGSTNDRFHTVSKNGGLAIPNEVDGDRAIHPSSASHWPIDTDAESSSDTEHAPLNVLETQWKRVDRTHGCLKVRTPQESVVTENQPTIAATSKPKHVTWGDLEIQTHALVLGDNPAVSKGCPLSLGWAILARKSMDIDSFEKSRLLSRRGTLDLVLPSMHREDLLRDEGYSRAELKVVSDEMRRIRKSRLVSYRRSVFKQLWQSLKPFVGVNRPGSNAPSKATLPTATEHPFPIDCY